MNREAKAQFRVEEDRVVVAGVVDFRSVMPLESEGLGWLRGQAPARAVIDLAEVTYSNSAGVALLLSWLRAARAVGKELVIENMPADMQSMVRVGGLEDVLASDQGRRSDVGRKKGSHGTLP